MAQAWSQSTPDRRQTQAPEKILTVFVELDTRNSDGFTVSLEWDPDTGQTQIVVNDIKDSSETVFRIANVNAADAFRHPFRYAP